MQWVALPPTPTNPHGHVRVGFILDSPCYNYKEEKGHVMQHNVEYRCKVVRILPPVEACYDSYALDLEIFSTETGEWREAIVKCLVGINLYDFHPFSFAYHGKLYWLDVENYNNCLNRLKVIGLNPFSDDDGLHCALDEHLSHFGYFGACGGCMRMCGLEDRSLIVLDLKEEGNGKLCLSKRMVYTLDQNMYPDVSCIKLLHFHPNNEDEDENEDVFYLSVDGDIVMYNIRTGKWSEKMAEKRPHKYNSYHRSFPIVLPWWPTPVPRLPQHAEQQLPHGGGTSS
ncbi:hypothetical protein ACE6H2_010008 [Prunus campanulata]